MSPFFHGSVRPGKKYPRPWSLNPRLNPNLDKGSARVSILGLPNFETGTDLPVFNGLYPKPSRNELSKIDEAVIINLNGDPQSKVAKEQPHEDDVYVPHSAETTGVTESSQENATTEVGSESVEKSQLEPIVEASTVETFTVEAPEVEAPKVEAPGDDSTREITRPEDSQSAPAPAPVPVLAESEPLPAEPLTVNGFVDHGSTGEDASAGAKTEHSTADDTAPGTSDAGAAAEATEAEQQPQTDAAGLTESAEVGNERHAADDDEGAQPDLVEPAVGSTHSGAEVGQALQSRDIPAETLPPVSEEPVENEELAHDVEHVESETNDQHEGYSGPAGLGPLEVIKEEAGVSEEPVMAAHEESAIGDHDLHGNEALANEVPSGSDLMPADATPTREVSSADTASLHDGEATRSEVLAASGLTPVDETPERAKGPAHSDEPGVNTTNLHENEVATDEVPTPSVLTPDETHKVAEEPAASNGPLVDHATAQDRNATSHEQDTSDDTTPVDERREFVGETDAVRPAFHQKDSLPTEMSTPFETPFETPMERRSVATEDSTPFETSFETPMERPFWASGAATQHASDYVSQDDEAAEAPFVPR